MNTAHFEALDGLGKGELRKYGRFGLKVRIPAEALGYQVNGVIIRAATATD